LRSIATWSEFPPTKSRRRRDEGKRDETLAVSVTGTPALNDLMSGELRRPNSVNYGVKSSP